MGAVNTLDTEMPSQEVKSSGGETNNEHFGHGGTHKGAKRFLRNFQRDPATTEGFWFMRMRLHEWVIQGYPKLACVTVRARLGRLPRYFLYTLKGF